jgi:sirohydrochlorin cobaltochelatase
MRVTKALVGFALAAFVTLTGAACSSNDPTTPPANSPSDVPSATAPTTGDPTERAILVVSFGTSYNDSREATIGAIERAIAAAYPDDDVRRAFTSQTIIDKLKARDGLEIDNVEQAMERLVADGIGTLVVQPTLVMNGKEYDEMRAAVAPFEAQFASLKFGQPLLISDADYTDLAAAIATETASYAAPGTAIVYMGHGTEAASNSAYTQLQDVLTAAGMNDYFVGTVEAEPDLEAVMTAVAAVDASKVVLFPLMIVAGDHATNDMAGDEEGSWKTEFKAKGYEVEPVLKGLGEYPGVQQLFVEHVGAALQ